MQLGQSYQQALAHVKTKSNLPLHTISKYVPYLDSEGILRVGGRLDYCQDLVEKERYPAFLPPSHDITKLFILDRHEKLGHRAAEMVVTALRQDVGILLIGGARTVRGYLADCFTCKLLCKTRAQQLMAPPSPIQSKAQTASVQLHFNRLCRSIQSKAGSQLGKTMAVYFCL